MTSQQTIEEDALEVADMFDAFKDAPVEDKPGASSSEIREIDRNRFENLLMSRSSSSDFGPNSRHNEDAAASIFAEFSEEDENDYEEDENVNHHTEEESQQVILQTHNNNTFFI